LNKKSYLSRISPYFGGAKLVPSKLPRTQGVVPHGHDELLLRSHSHVEQTESREKQGNNKLDRRSTATSLHPFFQRWYRKAPTGLDHGPLDHLSSGQQTEKSAISAGSRHCVSTKQPAVDVRSRSDGHQGPALRKMELHRALWEHHGRHPRP
jgi:hypothetical protein